MISARVISIMLACLVLVGLGAAGGVWLGARHYRPHLDAALADLIACRASRGELESAVAEQVRQEAEPRTLRVDVPVAVPCRVPAVEVPAWATAGLRKGDDIQTKVRALLAERLQRIGYEAQLLAANQACQD